MIIAHVSDTHLGRRIKQGRHDIINQETRPVESDFYEAWIKFVCEVTSNNIPDIIIHSGDFFDTPAGYDRSAPPEYARRIAATTFKKIKEAQIPMVIIDGNHGRLTEFRSSTLSEYADTFDNIHFFSHYDIRDAIREKRPLYKDFPELNLRIIAHPTLETRILSTLGISKLYEDWIRIQTSTINPEMINVAVAHGMTFTESLHPDFLKGNFNYIALGDQHKMEKVSENAWYAGSTERWTIDEVGQPKGYLLVNIEKDKAYPAVTVKTLDLPRKIISEEIRIQPDDTNSSIITKANDIFKRHNLERKYEYESAARVRIVLKGENTYGSSFNLGEVESYIRRQALDSDQLNIVEFHFKRPETLRHIAAIESDQKNSDAEYLVENPESEFKQYLITKRSEILKEQHLDAEMLAKIFGDSLKEATNE